MIAETQDPAGSLLCIGQTQPQTPRPPLLHPPDPSARQAAAFSSQQQHQQAKSAELVDGYQLHIRGDAMDALLSPVCAQAQARSAAEAEHRSCSKMSDPATYKQVLNMHTYNDHAIQVATKS